MYINFTIYSFAFCSQNFFLTLTLMKKKKKINRIENKTKEQHFIHMAFDYCKKFYTISPTDETNGFRHLQVQFYNFIA